jgi:hypothetical protein
MPWPLDYRNPDIPHVEVGGLLVAHMPFYPPGMELRYEFYDVKEFASHLPRCSVYYGHVHERHGVYRVGDVTFCNNGAISRGALHESDLAREPAITIYDDAPNVETFTRYTLGTAKTPQEVFRLIEKAEEHDYQDRLDEFLAQVKNATLGVLSVESVMAYVGTLDIPDNVKELIVVLLEEQLAA